MGKTSKTRKTRKINKNKFEQVIYEQKEKSKERIFKALVTFVTLMFAVLITLVSMGLSFGIVACIVFVLCWILSTEFTWSIVVVAWTVSTLVSILIELFNGKD